MRALFCNDGPRASILQSKGLQEPWLVEAFVKTPVASLYPDPASTEIILQVKEEGLGKQVCLLNAQGQILKVFFLTSTQQTINVSGLHAGMYFIKGEGMLEKFIKQ